MLTKFSVLGPSTFKAEASLETDKRVNLIYGLNGTGKSTICKFLSRQGDPEYSKCSTILSAGCEVLVFNDDFVNENFYESEKIPGIFSLSKKNKQVEEEISASEKERSRLSAEIESENASLEGSISKLTGQKAALVDALFGIKRSHSGGDRVLEFCLEGLLNSKEKLADHVSKVPKPAQEPGYSVKEMQAEVRRLRESEGKPPLAKLQLLESVEPNKNNELLSTAIVGSNNSTFSQFIATIGNSDWVREGLEKYVPGEVVEPVKCPFCQEKTLTKEVISELVACFDQTYRTQLSELESFIEEYDQFVGKIPPITSYKDSIFYTDQIGLLHSELSSLARENRANLAAKLESPSLAIYLKDCSQLVEAFNDSVSEANLLIEDHNEKIREISKSLEDIKRKFWGLMRWQHDSTIDLLEKIETEALEIKSISKQKIATLSGEVAAINARIVELRRNVVNTDEAIDKINAELSKMGIVDFAISKREVTEHRYELSRPGGDLGTFKSLSEGEKMIISLLYFCELAVGTKDPEASPKKRVLVLDDPISSLSHIYLFNVGRLLVEHLFSNSRVEQVFVFTHSLYFFYELTDINHDRRSKTQSLYRLTKNSTGSRIVPMSYEELQNDYHSYWQIVNDASSAPALVANCMRNIVEYFFGFVEKESFSNVFQKNALRQPHLQAFNRYMNRESHSFGQNIFDLKEFDYGSFREGFKLLFFECGYEEHYKKMSKL